MFKYIFLALLLLILGGVVAFGFLDLTPPAETVRKEL